MKTQEEQFTEWWEEITRNNGKWTSLERMSAKAAWFESHKRTTQGNSQLYEAGFIDATMGTTRMKPNL